MLKRKFNLKNVFFRYAPMLIFHRREIEEKREWATYYYMKKYLNFQGDFSFQSIKKNNVPENKTIWMYWKQGEENAPALVKKCINSVRTVAGYERVVVLNEYTINDYIEMPDFIEEKHKKGIIQEALYSDLLRISLLIHYGGIWCDATCFMTDKIPLYVKNASFFFFQQTLLEGWLSPSKCSNWFIKADKDCDLLILLRNVLFNYYYRNSVVPHYYIFHITLSLLVDNNDHLRQQWLSMPYVCNMNPHVFQNSFVKSYNPDVFEHVINSCFIHKLTYKYDVNLLNAKPINIIQYFLK